jgi:hypothetical protein
MRELQEALIVGLFVTGLLVLLIFHYDNSKRTARAGDWTAGVLPSMERIEPSGPGPTRTSVNIRAARGEYSAFQIVVSAGESAVTGVTLGGSTFREPAGGTIPGSSLIFYRERYIQVTNPSPDPGWGNRPLGKGWYPDALVPLRTSSAESRGEGWASGSFDVPAMTNQAVWVDVLVPRDTRPGDYTAAVNVRTARRQTEIRVSLHVWDFELPLRPSLQSSFGMHEPALPDRRVHELLLEHRVMPHSVNPQDARELADRFGLNTTGLRFWSNFSKKDCTMDSPPAPEKIAAARAQYPADVPAYLYSADEIDGCPQVFDKVRQWAAAMHKADGGIRNLVTVPPGPALESDGAGRPGVDIWALLPKVWDTDSNEIEKAQARGEQIWAYTALVQDAYSPKWEIDFAPINYRILPGLLAQSMGLTGILYWRVELWTAHPYEDLKGYSIGTRFFPGEGMLIYPGGPIGSDPVIPSMRLKWIRFGVQDFEYVAILKRLGRGEWALKRAHRVGTDWKHWTQDVDVLEATRDQLGEEIERLAGGQQTKPAF